MSETNLDRLDIFTIPLWSSAIQTHDQEKKVLIDFLDNTIKNSQNRNVEHFAVFETSRDIHNHPALDNFIKSLTVFGQSIKQMWSLDETSAVSINHMWATLTQKHGVIMPHKAPNSTLYGLYFLKTPPDSGSLSIEHPSVDTNFFYTYVPTNPAPFNTKKFVTPMPEGTMVLFPAYLKASITPNLSEEDRYIIHFSITLS